MSQLTMQHQEDMTVRQTGGLPDSLAPIRLRCSLRLRARERERGRGRERGGERERERERGREREAENEDWELIYILSICLEKDQSKRLNHTKR